MSPSVNIRGIIRYEIPNYKFEIFLSDEGDGSSSSSGSDDNELELVEATLEEAAADDGDFNDSNGDGNVYES